MGENIHVCNLSGVKPRRATPLLIPLAAVPGSLHPRGSSVGRVFLTNVAGRHGARQDHPDHHVPRRDVPRPAHPVRAHRAAGVPLRDVERGVCEVVCPCSALWHVPKSVWRCWCCARCGIVRAVWCGVKRSQGGAVGCFWCALLSFAPPPQGPTPTGGALARQVC